jgi:nicotinamidase-related amidase
MTASLELLIIDPQNDFCDLPEAFLPTFSASPVRPALPVPGAHADLQRVATLIRAAERALGGITVTLDTHQRLDIAHPTFWRTGDGAAVAPFTPITASDVRSRRFVPRRAEHLGRALEYLDALENRRRYTLMIWPVHCELGTWGHNVHLTVQAACQAWAEARAQNVSLVLKGQNPWTENYSALMAEVPLDDDPATQLNRALVKRLDALERLLICGEASSHCVRATTEHLVSNLADQTPQRLSRITLLTDCMSPVPGFEAQHAEFLGDMAARGLSLSTSAEVLASL